MYHQVYSANFTMSQLKTQRLTSLGRDQARVSVQDALVSPIADRQVHFRCLPDNKQTKASHSLKSHAAA